VAEVAAAKPFELLAREGIFAPLGLDPASFRLSDLPLDQIAIPHERNGKPLHHHGYLDFPAGTLRMSAGDLAKFLLAVMNRGTYQGVRILQESTVAEMLRVQDASLSRTQGLFWFIDQNADYGREQVIGHDGADPGTSTEMWYQPSTGRGIILLANTEPKRATSGYQIVRLLFSADIPSSSPPPPPPLARLPPPSPRPSPPPPQTSFPSAASFIGCFRGADGKWTAWYEGKQTSGFSTGEAALDGLAALEGAGGTPPPLPPPPAPRRQGVQVLDGGSKQSPPTTCIDPMSDVTAISGKPIAAQCCDKGGDKACRRIAPGKANNDDGCIAGLAKRKPPEAMTYAAAQNRCAALGLDMCEKSCKNSGCFYNGHPVYTKLACDL